MSTVLAILRKDLLLELRTLETVPAMVLFSVVTFVIFVLDRRFGLIRYHRDSDPAPPATECAV